MTIRLTEEEKIKLLNTGDVYGIMQKILLREKKIDRNKEHFWIICLANNNRIMMIELISLGTVNMTLVEPMEVFSFALQKQAVKIIMVHNHPSGELVPSAADIKLTDKMTAIGKFLRVPVIDHFIISEKSYFSFAEDGLLAKIEKESHFDLTFAKVEGLLEKMEKAEKETKITVAKKALAEGLAIDQIIKLTGLTKEEVEKLSRDNGKKKK